jgi:hypothetical protein
VVVPTITLLVVLELLVKVLQEHVQMPHLQVVAVVVPKK